MKLQEFPNFLEECSKWYIHRAMNQLTQKEI